MFPQTYRITFGLEYIGFYILEKNPKQTAICGQFGLSGLNCDLKLIQIADVCANPDTYVSDCLSHPPNESAQFSKYIRQKQRASNICLSSSPPYLTQTCCLIMPIALKLSTLLMSIPSLLSCFFLSTPTQHNTIRYQFPPIPIPSPPLSPPSPRFPSNLSTAKNTPKENTSNLDLRPSNPNP